MVNASIIKTTPRIEHFGRNTRTDANRHALCASLNAAELHQDELLGGMQPPNMSLEVVFAVK